MRRLDRTELAADPQFIRNCVLAALKEIEKTPKGMVRASRRSVCAAVSYMTEVLVFRRVGGTVRLEFWHSPARSGCVSCHPLPLDLEERAGRMLDSL